MARDAAAMRVHVLPRTFEAEPLEVRVGLKALEARPAEPVETSAGFTGSVAGGVAGGALVDALPSVVVGGGAGVAWLSAWLLSVGVSVVALPSVPSPSSPSSPP